MISNYCNLALERWAGCVNVFNDMIYKIFCENECFLSKWWLELSLWQTLSSTIDRVVIQRLGECH